MFGSRKRQVRRTRFAAGFLPEWRDLLDTRMRQWALLTDEERTRLEGLTLRMVAEKSWEPANGFDLADDIMVTIAAEASLIALALPDDVYRDVHSIIVHPTTLVLSGEHSQVAGIVSDSPMPILGQAEYRGPVVIVWDEALREARHPGHGHNVVFHEFAHKLDMLDGSVDGTPPLATQDEFDQWVQVCTEVYDEVVAGRAGATLSSYAGVNPAEFFAVATEVFFDNPEGLHREHVDLYDVLRGYYRQDPLSRIHGADRHA